MKTRSSLGTRLIAVFALINLVCFGLLGWHMERSFEAHVVATGQSVAARDTLILNHRGDMVIAIAMGMLTAVLSSVLLVRRALRPLDTMAASARIISTQNLDVRLSMDAVPRELDTLATALDDMLERLEQGFDRVWQFTVDLAHDLRTPLANLRGANEVALAHRRTPEEYEQLLESNIEECDRVGRMIDSVLFLARAESAQFALRRSSFNLAEELQRVADYFEGPSSEKGIDIHVDAQGDLQADRELFRRAISNLVDNAIRHAHANSTVSLTAERTGECVRVSVTNVGEGIDPEHLEKVFDRFYRLDKARHAAGGSNGLGLSIVKTVAELHSGSVGVESESGGYTRFTMMLPA